MTRPYHKTPAAELDRIEGNRAQIRRVDCPRCGAEKYHLCRTPSGHLIYSVHGARRSLAADTGLYVP